MLNFKKRRNSTSLDEIGLKLSLTRGVNESLEDFNRRVFKASNIKVDKESFYKSLGFVTPKQDIDFLKIEKVSVDDEVLITITDSHFQVEYVDEIIYRRKLKDIKFLKNLVSDLQQLDDYLVVEIITNEDWQYLKCENLMPTSTQRIRLKESINQKSQPLAETQVTDVQDFGGFFNINTFDEEIVFGRNEYSIEDKNFLHRSTEGIMNLMVYYDNYPLILKWLPIKCWDLSKETSEFLLKDKKKSTDLTLLPGEKELEAVLDNAEDFDILSQQGAKIANKLLAKQNTYWGK